MAETSLILLQQENLELTKENEGLRETVSKLLEEVNRLREITLPVRSNVEKVEDTAEKRIIREQIMHLESASMTRALSLEETRALDLLIKNKRLLEENKPLEPDWEKLPNGKTEDDLLRIAGHVEDEKPGRRKSKTSKKDPVA